jgi:hypothetical protein
VGLAEGATLDLGAGVSPSAQPRLGRNERGAIVLVKRGEVHQLAWIVRPGEDNCGLLFADRKAQWYPVPSEGYLADCVGPGSRVRLPLEKRWVEARVIRRLGVMVLVRFASREAWWLNVFKAKVLEARGGLQPLEDLSFSPWGEWYYPAYFLQKEGEMSRMCYPTDEENWVKGANIRTRPLEKGEKVLAYYKDERKSATILDTAGALIRVQLESDPTKRFWVPIVEVKIQR